MADAPWAYPLYACGTSQRAKGLYVICWVALRLPNLRLVFALDKPSNA